MAGGISSEITLRWFSMDIPDDTSTLVQVMAWHHQTRSHYMSQCWPWSLMPYGVTRPQCVNTLRPEQNSPHFGNIFSHWSLVMHIILLVNCVITGSVNSFPLDKMAAISQTIFSDTFSWMKSFAFWLKFDCSLFLRVQLTITQHWFK